MWYWSLNERQHWTDMQVSYLNSGYAAGSFISYFSRPIHYAHADVLGVLPVPFHSLLIVSWCHGGNTSAVSYFQDREEAVCDIPEKHFSSTCCCLGMAGNLMSPECVPPKLRILTHRSTIPQLMPSRHRNLSVKHKLHISVLSHNFCGKIPTKQHLLL